jgi:hypothetical protein
MIMLPVNLAVIGTPDWLEKYKAANAERLESRPDFAAWLATDFVPIAGGWQY